MPGRGGLVQPAQCVPRACLRVRRRSIDAIPDVVFNPVINIESAHCYWSMDTFLPQVGRVLRPGGGFSFADLRSVAGANMLENSSTPAV
jgi:hypothetical protein